MKKFARGLIVLLALMMLLTGCLPGKAVSTKSADNEGPSIETVIRKIKDQSFETLVAFDSTGKLLFEITSYERATVNLSKENLERFRASDGALFVHNHPSGTAFSVLDLRSEAYRKALKAAVVTKNDLYILEPGRKGWGDPEELSQTYENYIDRYMKEAQQDKDSLKTSTELEVWAYHQALTATALDFDLNYQRVPMDKVFCFRGTDVVVTNK